MQLSNRTRLGIPDCNFGDFYYAKNSYIKDWVTYFISTFLINKIDNKKGFAMRPLSILLICLFLTVGCARQNNSETSKSTIDKYRELTNSHEKVLFFQELVDRSLQWRSEALSFHDYIEKREIYSNQDILILHKQGTERYRKLRGELLATFRNVEWITDDSVQIKFVDEPTTIEVQKYEVKESSADNAETVLAERTIVYLNPGDAKGQRYIKETKTGLAAALLLYDNYLLVISQYQELKKTRRLLNYDNHLTRKYIDTVASNFLNPDNYRRTARPSPCSRKSCSGSKIITLLLMRIMSTLIFSYRVVIRMVKSVAQLALTYSLVT